MRVLLLATAALAAPAFGQVSIDRNGVRSGGVVIDSTGVHAPGASVTRHRVASRHAAAAHAGPGQSILGNGQTRTVDCGGGRLTVIGNSNVLTVRNCSRLSVPGNDNRIEASFAGGGSVTVMGNRNALTWRAPAAVKVSVGNVGTGNQIARGG